MAKDPMRGEGPVPVVGPRSAPTGEVTARGEGKLWVPAEPEKGARELSERAQLRARRKVVRAAMTQALELSVEEMTAKARALLAGQMVGAAGAWGEAIPVAAAKGDHRPARDLLVAQKVIEAAPKGATAVGVTVVVGGPDRPVAPPGLEVFAALEEGEG